MLVLTIMLVPTLSYAKTYSTQENVFVPEEVKNTFYDYFGNTKQFTYFPYQCGDFTCYYAIDKDNNYFDIKYSDIGVEFEKGIDNEFNFSGDNFYTSDITWTYVSCVIIIIIFIIQGIIWLI